MEHPRASSELPPIGSIRMDINGSVQNSREAALAVSNVAVDDIVVPIPPIVIPIAAERWNVQKKRLEFESEIDALYRVEIQKCMSIDKASNERATKLYNEVFYKAKWSNPPLPVVQQKLILGYCKHLLTIGTKVMYPHTESLVVWDSKHIGKVHEKTWKGLRKLSQKLFDLIERRDSRIKSTQSKLMQQTGAMKIKNDAHLRWMMESNFSKRDEYFSIWFLAATGNISVLKTLLNSTNKMKEYTYGINTADVDFGLSPLHYACKSIDLAMVRYLLSKGASVYQRSPDGRTPLHFAAAYSVKEVVLELLGEGGDALHGATDHHGRTALQLALQNHNKNTITTLQNWSKLTTLHVEDENIPLVTGHHDGTVMNKSSSITVKSRSPSKNKIDSTAISTTAISPVPYDYPVDDDDDSNKGVTAVPPYEYQVAADEVVSKMSPSLRLMLKRLNSYNKFYLRCKKTNHDPSDMLRSKDLSVISAMLQSSSSVVVVVGADHEGGVKHYNTSINNNYQDNSNNNYQDNSMSNNNYQDNTNNNNNYQDNTNSNNNYQDNSNNNYQDNTNSIAAIQERIDEILVEIRLTTKCYSLCVQECFLDEAMRALRRRWTIAKELWMMLVKLQRDGMDQQQVPTAVANLDVAVVEHSHHMNGYNGKHHVLQTRQYTLGGALDISHNDEGDNGGHANSASPLQSGTYIESQSDRMRSDEGVSPPRPILNGVDPSLHPPDAYSTVYEACDREFTPLFAEQQGGGGGGGRRPTEIDDDKDDDDDDDDDDREDDAGAAPSGGSTADYKIGVTDILMEEENSINSRRRGRSDVSTSSSSSSSSTIIDLEQLAVAYNMSHPTPCSSIDDLHRPTDYESIGIPVYKISEGIFWESGDDLNKAHHVEAGITDSMGNNDDDVDAGKGSAILQHQSSAVDVIKQWQQISKTRSKKQQSVLDIYYWINDESLRDDSLLTESNVDDTSSHLNSGSINSHERHHQQKKTNQQKDKLRSPTGPSVVSDEDDASTVLNHSVDSFSYLSNHLHHHSSYKYQYPFRGSYIVKLGMELSSAFITRRDEGSALLVAHECGDITVEVDHVTRIAMLERQCDILLFLYDYLSKHPPPLTHRARVMLNAVKKLSRVSIRDDGDNDDAVVRLEKVSLSVEQSFVSDSINGGVKDVNPSSPSSSSPSSSSSTTIMEKANNVRFIDQQLAPPSIDDTYRKSFSSILSLCTTILEESLQLHRTFYSADIIEPISFSIALSRRSKVFELQQRDEESLLSMQAAEEAAVRTLGGTSHEAIIAALEVLRLWIKYRLTTREELTFVNKKAQQINSNIVQYSQIDIEIAERFTKRCVEYVSIATVAVNRVEEEEDKARRSKRREERRIALERIS